VIQRVAVLVEADEVALDPVPRPTVGGYADARPAGAAYCEGVIVCDVYPVDLDLEDRGGLAHREHVASVDRSIPVDTQAAPTGPGSGVFAGDKNPFYLSRLRTFADGSEPLV
jgi:hypothetical protein